MEEKKIVENIFKNKGISWKIKDYNNYINPGCKTPASIYSKLMRLYSTTNNKNEFTILNSGLNDLLRMTIIVDYNDITNIIGKLKSTFPDLTGYMKSKSSGYRGIHLNLKIDGITCEIQLAPKIVVMAVDYLHTLHEKWRDFDKEFEIKNLEHREKEISLIVDKEKKNKLMKLLEHDKDILKRKIKEEEHDFHIRKSTYDAIFDATKFYNFKEEISNALCELNKIKKDNNNFLNNPELLKLFNTNLLNNGYLDKDKLKIVSDKLPDILGEYQEKFVHSIENCLKTN